MLELGFRKMYVHPFRTVILFLQLSLLMFMGIFVSTTVVKQAARYLPYADFLRGKGNYVLKFESFEYDVHYVEELLPEMKKVDRISTVNYMFGYAGNKSYEIIEMNDLNERYCPILSEGRWIDSLFLNRNKIYAVAAQESGLHAGDRIELDIEGSGELVTVDICGILAAGASVISPNGTQTEKGIFSFYDSWEYYSDETTNQNTYALIMNEKSFSKAFGDRKIEGDNIFIRYEDDITEEEWAHNNNVLSSKGFIVGRKLTQIGEESLDEVMSKLSELFPVAVGGLILIGFGVAGIVMIDTKKNLRDYAVFYICGSRWKSCCYANVFSSGVIAVLGYLAAVTAGRMIRMKIGNEKIAFESGRTQGVVCLLIFAYVVLIAFTVTRHILRKNTPVEVFRKTA